MSRRPALAAVAASLLAGTFPVSAETVAPELPRPNCAKRLIDPSGDALLVSQAAASQVDGLDLTGVHLRVTPTEFQVLLAVKDVKSPSEMGPADPAYQYVVSAKHTEKWITFKLFQKNTQQPWTTAQSTPGGTTRGDTGPEGSPGGALPGWTGVADPAKNYVIFTAPRDKVEANFGFPLSDGSKFEAITVTMAHYVGARTQAVDTLNVTGAAASWTVGDDYCFGAPPATLADLTTPEVVYTDTAVLSAKLNSEAGAAVAGKTVSFTVAGERAPLTAVTGADGVASVTYAPTVPAGTHDVTVRFDGDTEHGKATLTGAVVVKPETTAIGALKVTKPTATTRTVTATLLDNDGKPVAAQRIDWYVNGKKVSTIVTDSAGRSVFKTAKPTQTVLAKFPGLAGKYLAATAKAVKV